MTNTGAAQNGQPIASDGERAPDSSPVCVGSDGVEGAGVQRARDGNTASGANQFSKPLRYAHCVGGPMDKATVRHVGSHMRAPELRQILFDPNEKNGWEDVRKIHNYRLVTVSSRQAWPLAPLTRFFYVSETLPDSAAIERAREIGE